jgi:hypothetical protein
VPCVKERHVLAVGGALVRCPPLHGVGWRLGVGRRVQ